jgi:hypothetical protein
MRPSHFIAALDDVSVSNTSALPRMVKDWLPPALWLLLRRLRYGDDALYEYVGPEWPKEIGAATGWDEPFAIEIMEANWERYRAMAEGTEVDPIAGTTRIGFLVGSSAVPFS